MQTLPTGTYSGLVTKINNQQGFLTCVTSYHPEQFNNALHYHTNTHFSFVLSGGCIEKKKDSYPILPGELTFYPAGELHQVTKVSQGCKRINIELESQFFNQYDLSENEIQRSISKNVDAKFLMIKLYKELVIQDAHSPLSSQVLLLQLISQAKKVPTGNKRPPWVKIVNDLLHDCPESPASLGRLAYLAGVHPVTLSKQFPHYFGCTLGQYKRKLTIERSLPLLRSSPLSLTEIAHSCGFFDQSHFIRVFKEFTGFLPFAFRKA